MIACLTEAQRTALLPALEGWTRMEGRDAIRREFRFADFATAFGFMTQVAILAEKADHHPEWFNVYNRVDVVLTTHDCDGLSERDVALAQAMNRIAAKMA
jgi:4a-hydroxytetrahydrobiopterin dehydratase